MCSKIGEENRRPSFHPELDPETEEPTKGIAVFDGVGSPVPKSHDGMVYLGIP